MHHPSNHQKKGVFPGFHNYILHVVPNVRPEKNNREKKPICVWKYVHNTRYHWSNSYIVYLVRMKCEPEKG